MFDTEIVWRSTESEDDRMWSRRRRRRRHRGSGGEGEREGGKSVEAVSWEAGDRMERGRGDDIMVLVWSVPFEGDEVRRDDMIGVVGRIEGPVSMIWCWPTCGARR